MNVDRYYNGQPIAEADLCKIVLSGPTIESVLRNIEDEFQKYKKDSKKQTVAIDNFV